MKIKLTYVLLFVLLFAMIPAAASAVSHGSQSGWTNIANAYDNNSSTHAINTVTGANFVTNGLIPGQELSYEMSPSQAGVNKSFTVEFLSANNTAIVQYSSSFNQNRHIRKYIIPENATKARFTVGSTSSSVFIRMWEVRMVAPPPAKPIGLSAVSDNQQVLLNWDAVDEAESYNVYRSLAEGGPYSLINNVVVTNYGDTDVENSTAYYYVVTAVNNAGESGYSNEAAATLEGEVPDAPANLTASGEEAQISLNWNEVEEAGTYNVYRSLTEGGPYTVIGSVYGAPYSDTNVENGITYHYVVTAVNVDGESGYSNEVAATPEYKVPSAPTNLMAVAGNFNVYLIWDPVEGAVTYNIKRSLTEGGPYTVIDNQNSTAYSDLSVDNGTTYYYVVTAVNNDGESDPSNEASVTPFAPEPEDNLRALLTLYLTGGQEKEYDVSAAELDAFLNWFDDRAFGNGPERYGFDKTWNKGPFKTRTEYVIFSKIDTFDVDEYEVEE